jgi:hypothetical protein
LSNRLLKRLEKRQAKADAFCAASQELLLFEFQGESPSKVRHISLMKVQWSAIGDVISELEREHTTITAGQQPPAR